MKKLLLFGLIATASLTISAQQDAMFTHYAFNTLAVNPAYAGSRDALTITGLHRSQWVGFDGAPTTQTLTLHTPIFKEQLGAGLSIMNDKIGPVNNFSITGDFSYNFKVTQNSKLAFGLKGGINLLQGTLSDVPTETANDPTFVSTRSDILPNFGFGAYYYTSKWYAGISTPKLLENDYKSNTVMGSQQRHFFFIAGTVFDLNKKGTIKLKPTTFVKVTEAAPIEADITGMFIIQDTYEIGAMFRSGDAAGLLLGYNLNEQLRIGYSFDWSFTNKTGKYNSGSHELMLRYDFIYKSKRKIRSIRYF